MELVGALQRSRIIFLLAVTVARVQPDSCSFRTEFHGLHHPFKSTFTACDCQDCSKPIRIDKAWLIDPFEKQAQVGFGKFWYDFKGNELPQVTGSYNYSFWYSCRQPRPCECKTPLSLVVKIAEFQLSAPHTDDNGDMILNCSSGLQDSSKVKVLFNYTSSNAKKRKELCKAQPFLNDRWLIYRNEAPPYNCVLKVVNFSSVDYGTYQCYGILSGKEYDVSNVQQVPTSPEHNSGLASSVIAAIVIVPLVIVALFVTLGACCCVLRWRVNRRRAPYEPMAEEHVKG